MVQKMFGGFLRIRRRSVVGILSAILSLLLIGCQDDQSNDNELSDAEIDHVLIADSGWPRTLQTVKGPVTLAREPMRIVSTSVTITGTLLTINAPVIASGATMPNTRVADEQGFFKQWGQVAKDRGVIALYQTEPNAEAIINMKPDLIIISATGGDSARKLYNQLSSVAPTVLIGYDDKSWSELAITLGQFIGHEQDARNVIENYDDHLRKLKQSLELPPQPSTAMVYYLNQTGANIWTNKSAQGRFLESLGFQLAKIPDSVRGNLSMGRRDDIIIATGELLPVAITGKSVLLFSADDQRIKSVIDNSYLAQTTAVKNKNIFAMGNDNFRLDYYSATNLLNRLSFLFGEKTNLPTPTLE